MPRFGKRPFADIRRKEVRQFVRDLANVSIRNAYNVNATLGTLAKWAIEEEIIENVNIKNA